ncbi:AAA family ATPase [Bacillaceae bacterium]
MLEAIAYQCGFHTAGGGRNNRYEVYASESALGDYIRLSWLPKVTNGFFLRAESFYHFATYLDEVDDTGWRQIPSSTIPWRSFFVPFLNRFQGKAIYLLDEPESALSPARQLAFLKIIHDLTSNGSAQFIIATHSPIILGYPDATILSFDGGRITKVDYETTDHYQISKSFLQNREKCLLELLAD